MSVAEPARQFGGTERYEVLERLGGGGMGEVYRVRDRERGVVVALKLLRRADPTALYRFKQEFRALADLSHPNLVEFYEMVAWEEQWFFTMEYIEGVHFLSYVREGAAGDEEDADVPDTEDREPNAAERIPWNVRPSRPGSPRDAEPATDYEDEEDTALTNLSSVRREPIVLTRTEQFDRLQQVFRQLVEGVSALHDAGHLHRDIKPSNLLVGRDGRLVLLDFGVMTELARVEPEAGEGRIVGTPAYMAPEQAAGGVLARGSDWYSVGVVLYESITGRRPFGGSVRHSLEARARFDPKPPATFAPRTPSGLNALCMDLLSRNPNARPDGKEVLRRLGVAEKAAAPLIGRPRREPDVLVGRERHLEALRNVFRESVRGQSHTVLVHGGAGMGKSALVQRFLAEIEQEGEAVVLTGRCYEHESMPYKAVDPLIDALSRHLLSLSRSEVETVVPTDMPALARLFPVLQRVEAVIGFGGSSPDPARPLELRRRAFLALRDLLSAMAARRPVLIFIDDLQWGDTDSAALIKEVVRPPQPRLLFLGAYRDEDSETSPFLRTLLPLATVPVEIAVEPLSSAETLLVADKLLGGITQILPTIARSIARESGGSPFFIHELVRYVHAETFSDMSLGTISLEEVIRVRLSELPSAARRLLEVIAVAGQPVSQATARRAAELTDEEGNPERMLLARNLIRTRGGEERGAGALETYHDRIREVAVSLLSHRRLQKVHHNLAVALSVEAEPDPESLADHFAGAGDLERAAQFCVKAAEKAAEALAFDRAALLYQRALSMREYEGQEGATLRAALAKSLGEAARGAEAAQVYLEAAELAGAADALEYRRLAAEHLLRSGHIDRGIDLIEAVLGEVGLQGPRSPKLALLSLAFRRARLRLRGVRFKKRDASEIPPAELRRLDVCWAAATGQAMVDQVRGVDYQTRHMLLALRAGEPYRLARAAAVEAGFQSVRGPRGQRRAEKLVDLASRLSEGKQAPDLVAWINGVRGLIAYQGGRFREAMDYYEATEATFRTHGGALAFELTSVQLYTVWALYYLGDISSVVRRAPRFLREAEERNDLYSATNLSTGLCIMSWLARDEAAEGRRIGYEAIRRWSHRGYHLQHYWEFLGRAQAVLYLGEVDEANRILAEDWPRFEHSVITGIPLVNIEANSFRGRCALLSSTEAREPEKLRRLAEKAARKIEKWNTAYGTPMALLIRAGAAALRGSTEVAVRLLEDSIAGFEAADMMLHANVARWQLGRLLGGSEGREMTALADSWMREQTIVRPDLIAAMFAPGFDR